MENEKDKAIALADATAKAIAKATAAAAGSAEPPTRVPPPIGGTPGSEPPTRLPPPPAGLAGPAHGSGNGSAGAPAMVLNNPAPAASAPAAPAPGASAPAAPPPLPLATKVAQAPGKPEIPSGPPALPAAADFDAGSPLLGVLFVIALLAAGVAYLAFGTVDNKPAPTPGAIFAAVTKLRAEQVSWAASQHTLISAGIGLGGALVLGLGLGALVGLSRSAKAFFEPLVIVVRSVPAIALLPLGIVWFGTAHEVGWGMAFAAAFIVLVMMGARIADDRRRRGRFSWRWFWLACEIGLLLAFGGALAAEMLAGKSGLGGLLIESISANDLPRAFAVVGMIAIWGFVLPLVFAVLRWASPR
jgi:ABC-type nitrate/sulfonate/bicarbonate transport system permease component